jgi:hypothetical protein
MVLLTAEESTLESNIGSFTSIRMQKIKCLLDVSICCQGVPTYLQNKNIN